MTENSVFCLIIGLFLFRPVSINGQSHCANAGDEPKPAIQKFCLAGSKAAISPIYLDASDFPFGDIGECPCSISNTGRPIKGYITINAVRSSKRGNFMLEVDGKPIDTSSQHRVPYSPDIPIVLRKATSKPVTLCLEIEIEREEDNQDEREINNDPFFQIQCYKRRDINSVTSQKEEFGGRDGVDSSNTGIIIAAIVGGLFVIVIVAVVVIVVCRRRSNPPVSKDRQLNNHQGEKTDQTGQYQLTDNAGYVSADDVDNKAEYEEPGQTYDYIVHTDAVTEHPPAADQGVMGYASLSEYSEYCKPETDTPPKHDAEGYDVLNKYGKEPANKSPKKNPENVYNRTDNPKVITPTGHIYGVGTPVNQMD